MTDGEWGRRFRDRAELFEVLGLVLDRLAGQPFEYRLVGTGAAMAQGVTLPVGDIDLLVKRRDEVDGFARALVIEHMRTHGADLPLVEQAMRDRSLNPGLQQQILDRLR